MMNRMLLRLLVGPLSLGLLLTIVLQAGAAGDRTHHPSSTRIQTGQATLILSHDGRTLAVKHFLCGPKEACNIIEFDWSGGHCTSGEKTQNPPVVIVFTTAGQYDGKPALAPCGPSKAASAAEYARHDTPAGVNDVEYAPTAPGPNGAQSVGPAWWTKNGVMVSKIIPPGLNSGDAGTAAPPPDGLHVYWSYGRGEHLSAIRLRFGKRIVAKVGVPAGTNQAVWYGYTPRPLSQAVTVKS